jgi:hypothetical protein
MRLIHENSPLKVAWDVLICAVALATGLILPLELIQGFSYGHMLTTWWNAFSALGLVDAALTFFTTYESQGVVVRDRRRISRHYLRGWFWLDILANLPFFVLNGSYRGLSLISLLPLLRLQQLFRITSRWEDIQLLNTAVLRILRYGMSIMLITNWISCLWLWIGLRDFGPQGWIQRLELSRNNLYDLYLHSLYWTVTTLATVGYGDIVPKTHPEIIMAIIMMITGATLYAFAVGNVVSILNQLDGGRSEFRKNQSAIASYLSLNGVESDVITRVRRFNDYQWSRTRGFVPGVLFDQLPTDLRTEVTYSMLRDTVQRVPLFTAAPPPLQKRLLQLLQPRTYPPGTALLHPHEQGNEIVFITKGEAEIEGDEPVPQEIQYLTSGDYIGDLSFFLNERRNCGAMARSYVDALVLSRSVLERLRQEEPDMKMVLQAMAQKQSQRNQALLLAGLVL